MSKVKGFREKVVSHFHVSSVVTRGCVFLAALSCNSRQKTSMPDFRYKSLKPWKIDNIDLTQQFSWSIFTDFRYQSMKITWLLPIFIDWLLRDYQPLRQNRNPVWISVSSVTKHIPVRRQLQFADASFLLPKRRLFWTWSCKWEFKFSMCRHSP